MEWFRSDPFVVVRNRVPTSVRGVVPLEGPSVHRLSETLSFFEDQVIEDVGGNAKQPIDRLRKRTIRRVRSVKKRLFFDTGEVHAVIHFLMYGSYRVNEPREDLDERLTLACSRDDIFFYSCSAKVLSTGDEEWAEYDRPDQDVLSPEFDLERARTKLSRYEGPVVDVLLDQQVFGGVGNIIKNEALFRARVHPETPGTALPGETLERLIDHTMDFAREWLEKKRNDDPLNMKIYRADECPRCGDEVTRTKMGKYDRVTYFCDRCQDRD